MEQNTTSAQISDDSLIGYGVVMILVTTLGMLGNTTMVIILLQAEHRTKIISYLMLNLSLANIIICGFGYPVAMSFNLNDFKTTSKDDFRCWWMGFINATSGITCILTLTLMSVAQYRGVTQIAVPSLKLSISQKKQLLLLLIGTWVSAILLSAPPMFGWNRFVPVQSGVSCHPDWESQDPKDKAYIWFLVAGGFFVPLAVMCVFYGLTYRHMQRIPIALIGDFARNRRLAQQKKLSQMITAIILAFLLSWSPYCVVSLISNFKGSHVISPELSLVPELMAKSSVIYNPIIFNCVSTKIRSSLLRIITSCSNCKLGLSSRSESLELEGVWVQHSFRHSRSLHRHRSRRGLFADRCGQRKRAFTIEESI